MRREYKAAILEAVLVGVVSGIGGSLGMYAIKGEFPWASLIISITTFSIVWLPVAIHRRERRKNIPEKGNFAGLLRK